MIAEVQAIISDAVLNTPASVYTLSSNTTLGNRLVFMTLHTYAGCPPSISDNRSNSYTTHTNGVAIKSGGPFLWVWSAEVTTAGSTTISVPFNCGYLWNAYCAELSGVDHATPFFGSSYAQDFTSPFNAGAGVSVTVAGAFGVALTLADVTPTPSTGWTARGVATPTREILTAANVAVGTLNTGFTGAATEMSLGMAVFQSTASSTAFRPYYITG